MSVVIQELFHYHSGMWYTHVRPDRQSAPIYIVTPACDRCNKPVKDIYHYITEMSCGCSVSHDNTVSGLSVGLPKSGETIFRPRWTLVGEQLDAGTEDLQELFHYNYGYEGIVLYNGLLATVEEILETKEFSW